MGNTTSQAQIDANRNNAGKGISSHNAVKAGLTGTTVLPPSDDVAAYGKHLRKRELDLDAAGHIYERFKKNSDLFHPAEFGFEFSIDEIEQRAGLWTAGVSVANTPNSSLSSAPGNSAKNAKPPEANSQSHFCAPFS